jgi:hypothetical protein
MIKIIKIELRSSMDSWWLDDELHWIRDIQKSLIDRIINIWKVLLILKYVSISIVLSGCITMIYVINILDYLSSHHLFYNLPYLKLFSSFATAPGQRNNSQKEEYRWTSISFSPQRKGETNGWRGTLHFPRKFDILLWDSYLHSTPSSLSRNKTIPRVLTMKLLHLL